ncbi:Hypothetical_protein [Hexamita inflata]|uniref:Hypothetical_protein n=1 Tax=Hexamita inflata TaxID=28002 RepID=A0AA86NJ39_9EUKA|nr:Hypothetical protein HINF_LOCUS8484 [Hexamita inflata]
MTIHKSKLRTLKRDHKLISTSYLIFQDSHSEQPPQTTQVSSTLELRQLTSEAIFVTIFGAGIQFQQFSSSYQLWENIWVYILELDLLILKTNLQYSHLKITQK